MHDQNASEWSKSVAPIARVLNADMTALYSAQPQHAGASATPFSGKLGDLLLDPADVPSTHRRTDSQPGTAVEPSIPITENAVIQLPKPPQLPKQAAKRPRIPPLLQGLHQPPPLPPTGRLFPPITEGVVESYERDARERVDVDAGQEERQSRDEAEDFPPTAGNNMPEKTVVKRKPHNRKRRKWTEEETRALLFGVSRFGIGSWTKILKCKDYDFHGRTAVDLKDRFRVCCPGEGLKPRKPKGNARQDESADRVPQDPAPLRPGDELVDPRLTANDPPSQDSSSRPRPRHGQRKPKISEKEKAGIVAPFKKNPRRPRQPFTREDDRNLWRGFEKHWTTWSAIRDDPEFDFGERYPTDLRDRFRIRFPEAFRDAGFKPKPRVKLLHGDSRKTRKDPTPVAPRTTDTDSARQPKNVPDTTTTTRAFDQEPFVLPSFSLRAPATLPFLGGSSWLDDMSNTSFDGDGSGSPIVLNRNILEWADSNTYITPTRTTSYNHMPTDSTDVPSSYPDLSTSNDMFHIDPMADLKLPSLSLSSGSYMPPSQQPSLQLPPTSAFANTLITPVPAPTSNPTTIAPCNIFTVDTPTHTPSKSTSNVNTLLRAPTPNLPTIVFPNVPVESARNTLHLPPPADLLSGVLADGEGLSDMMPISEVFGFLARAPEW